MFPDQLDLEEVVVRMSIPSFLQEALTKTGRIPFVDFMQAVLYTPNEGYYSRAKSPFSNKGDFITAPEMTPLFGHTLGTQCEQILPELTTPVLFEFGAGSGKLCVNILEHLASKNCLPNAYYILEVSGTLKQQQADTIQRCIPELAHLVTWLRTLPQESFEGIIIANEVLDAMPVHRFMTTDADVLESHVTLNDNNELIERYYPTQNSRLRHHVQHVVPKESESYQSEANLFIDGWLQQCAAMLDKGVMLLIDYGFPQHEYYHPDRHQGTLMCHYQQRSHANPLIHLGEQDITAHVDFTHVAEAAFEAGFTVAGYTSQAAFLLSNGILDHLEAISNEQERLSATQAIKRLLQPHEMGELFKVMALNKHLSTPLQGFTLDDKRGTLS